MQHVFGLKLITSDGNLYTSFKRRHWQETTTTPERMIAKRTDATPVAVVWQRMRTREKNAIKRVAFTQEQDEEWIWFYVWLLYLLCLGPTPILHKSFLFQHSSYLSISKWNQTWGQDVWMWIPNTHPHPTLC